jgi:hypothetical protein
VLLRLIKEVSLLVQNKAAFYGIVKVFGDISKDLGEIIVSILLRPSNRNNENKDILPK